MNKVRTRIAPSPTGSPHIGTAYAALFNYVFAKKHGGNFVLRIEDTDRTRLVAGSEEEIYEALSWLGLETDEGPVKGGNFGPYRQSERLEIYKEFVSKLVKADKAYYCDCSSERLAKIREEQQARKEVPHYDRKCRYEPPQDLENSVIRLAVPLDGETEVEDLVRGKIIFENKLIDDQVLMKSDDFPTYHLASVVDDHLMEISHVIRAEEWLSSTPKHVLLYQAFGWELPQFAHLPLLRNRDRSKISKRKNPVAIDFYRKQGYLPEALVNFLALMGWSLPDDQEIFTLDEMIKNFTFERIGTVGPIFDVQKLDWMNGHYIRTLSNEELAERLVKGGFVDPYPINEVMKYLPLVKDRMKRLSEFKELASYYLSVRIDIDPKQITALSGSSNLGTVSAINSVRKAIEEITPVNWTSQTIEELLNKSQEQLNWNKTKLFQTIRYSVSGSTTTPPLGETLEAIGKDKVIDRLTRAEKKLNELSD